MLSLYGYTPNLVLTTIITAVFPRHTVQGDGNDVRGTEWVARMQQVRQRRHSGKTSHVGQIR